MTVAHWRAFSLGLASGVVFQKVVGDELKGVLRTRLAYLGEGSKHGGSDGGFEVLLGGQVVDADGRLSLHGSELSSMAHLEVGVAALPVQVGVAFVCEMRD